MTNENKNLPYRLVAVDLDDTLLNGQLQISPRTKAAIHKAREAGVVVTIATGRMYRSAVPYAQELGLDLPLITYQGALIKSALTGETILHQPVPAQLAQQVLDIARAQGLHINFYLNDRLYMEEWSDAGQDYARLARVQPDIVPDLSQLLPENPTKVLMIGNPEELNQLQFKLKAFFGQELHITKSKPQYLEFIHPHASKGAAITHLAKLLNIQLNQVIAMGDSFNDVEMLQVAGCAVVMGNAQEEIKGYADLVTASNESDGVALALEKLIFHREG